MNLNEPWAQIDPTSHGEAVSDVRVSGNPCDEDWQKVSGELFSHFLFGSKNYVRPRLTYVGKGFDMLETCLQYACSEQSTSFHPEQVAWEHVFVVIHVTHV